MTNQSALCRLTVPSLVYSVDSPVPKTTKNRMEVASYWPDYLPTLSVAKTSKFSLLVKHHILAIDDAS